MQVRWMRKRRAWWRRIFTLESAVIALCAAILGLLAVMARAG